VGRKVGETEYLIAAVPLGGYVKLLGEDPGEELSEAEKVQSFSNQSVGKRLAVVAAGPLFNLFLAVFIFVIIFMTGVPVLTSHVGVIQENSPAAAADLKSGDHVVSIDGHPVTQWDEIKEIIQKSEGRELKLVLERDGIQIPTTLTPRLEPFKNILGDDLKEWRIGVSPKGSLITKRYDPLTATLLGFKRTWEVTELTVLGIIRLIEGKIPSNTIGGPILIAQMAGQQAAEGFLNIVLFIAILSINLGVINLLPIPILDGGHILFFIVEALMGRPLSLKKREIAQQIGLFILISLMIFAFYNDIMRIFTKPG
jgi:regulator of sigma E protease